MESSIAPWNGVRFAPSPRSKGGHVESYFLKLNDGKGRRALWLKATILSRSGGPTVAEAWAIAFDREGTHRAAKEVIPFPSARFSDAALDVEVARVRIQEGKTTGALDVPSRLAWDLRFEGTAPPLVPFAVKSFYTGGFPRSKLVSPHPDLRFFGHYEVEGERIEVDGWRGMQGHNWGKSHAYRYAWGHCNSFLEEPELVFEGVTAQVRLGPAVTPPLTILCIRHRGVRYEWNRPLDLLRAKGHGEPGRWSFEAENDLGTIEGEMRGKEDLFVGLYYENPSGPTTHCLNSKIADIDLRFRPRGRPLVRASSHEAALEIGTTDPSHGVRMVV
jgi:hypothetical protein